MKNEFIKDQLWNAAWRASTQRANVYSKKFSRNGISFKIGHSQKLLNLMLKYYWCLEWLKYTPPHCPIDRMILVAAKVKINGKTPS